MSTILGTIDRGGDGKTILLELVNIKDGTSLSLNDFEFTAPTTPVGENPIRNTIIKLAPKASSGYYGVKTIYYNRIHVSELGVILLPKGSASTLFELIPTLNEAYGILVTQADIENVVLPDADINGNISVTLQFKPTSVVFYGGAVIQVGDGTGSQAAFTIDTTLFGNDLSSYPNGANQEDSNMAGTLFEQWSVAIDPDFHRKVVCDNFPSANSFTAEQIHLNTLAETGSTKGIRNKYPFVTSWEHTNGKIRALTPLGEVLESLGNGDIWSTVGNLGANKRNSSADVALAFPDASTNAGLVFQAAVSETGVIYAIYSNGSNGSDGFVPPLVYKSTTGGATWTSVTVGGGASPAFLNTTTYYQDSQYADFVVRGNYLYFISSVYKEDESGNTETINLEIFNSVTGVYSNIPLNNMVFTNTNIRVGSAGKQTSLTMAFVMDPLNTGTPNIAVYGQSSISGHPFVGLIEISGSGVPSGTIVNTEPLLRESLEMPGSFIQAYTIALERNPGVLLDVIEITHPFETTTPDLGFTYAYLQQARAGYHYTFGQKVYTSLRNSLGRMTVWKESNLQLGPRYIPMKVRLRKHNGTYVHAVSQRSNYLSTKRFTWSELNKSYSADVKNVITYDSAASIGSVLRHGFTKTVAHSVIERVGGEYVLPALPAPTESTKPTVALSLVGIDSSTNTPVWYTTTGAALQPLPRSLANEYGFLGKVPTLTVADGVNFYAYTETGTIIRSTNSGRSWSDHSVYAHIGKPSGGKGIANAFSGFAGVGKEMLKPNQFVRGGSVGGALFAEIATQATFSLPKVSGGTSVGFLDAGMVGKHGKVLVSRVSERSTISTTKPSVYNSLLSNSPFKVKGWDVEAVEGGSSLRIVGKQHEQVLSGGSWLFNPVDYVDYAGDESVAVNPAFVGEVVGYYSNLKYLNVKYAVLTKVVNTMAGTTSYNVYWVKEVGAVVTLQSRLAIFQHPTTSNFADPVGFHLWGSGDADYVPFLIWFGAQAVGFVFSPLNSGGNTLLLSTNGSLGTLAAGSRAIPLFNANRFEYLFTPTAGGHIYKLRVASSTAVDVTLAADMVANTSTIPSTVSFNTACMVGTSPVIVPLTPGSGPQAGKYYLSSTGKYFVSPSTGAYYVPVQGEDVLDGAFYGNAAGELYIDENGAYYVPETIPFDATGVFFQSTDGAVFKLTDGSLLQSQE